MIWDIAGVIAWTLLVAGSLISLFVVLVMAVEMFRQRSVRLRSERERQARKVIVLQHRDGTIERRRAN